jgi:hypothetical protein
MRMETKGLASNAERGTAELIRWHNQLKPGIDNERGWGLE